MLRKKKIIIDLKEDISGNRKLTSVEEINKRFASKFQSPDESRRQQLQRT